MHNNSLLLAQSRVGLLVGLALLIGARPFAKEKSEDKYRFSDQPAPLRLEGFPERPALLVELGDKFLGTGNLQRGFTLPTGAVWSPSLWVFGTMRSSLQTFEPGSRAPANTRITEWANRLDLFANLQLAATERILIGFRPLEENTSPPRFTGYQFAPENPNTPGNATREGQGYFEAFSTTPRVLFFEGELGEIFPDWDQADKLNLDYSVAVGRQPLTLQDGLLASDDSIDMVSITRNSLNVPGGTTLRISGYYAWDQIERGDNQRDFGARVFGVNAAADFPVITMDADLIYVSSDRRGPALARTGGDGLFAGVSFNQRIGKVNTVFRATTSIALDGETRSVRNGSLLFAEISITPEYGHDLVYLNFFWGIDEFTSAVRAPTAGGPLGRLGILNAAVGLGRYGAPLSNFADNSVGGALGYQMFFGELRRRQLILEFGSRTPTRPATLLRQEAASGLGARFQQAFGRRTILVLDVFGVSRRSASNSFGFRTEFLIKF